MSNKEHFKVAIIGGGPAGIGVAVGLAKQGVNSVVLIERRTQLGGTPQGYRKKSGSVPTFIEWTRARIVFGEELAQRIIQRLTNTNTKIKLCTHVTKVFPLEKKLSLLSPKGLQEITADAIVLAAGAREQTPSEKGWLAGTRTVRTGFTRHINSWLDNHNLLPVRKPLIIGSDLIAYSAAAKLRAAGSKEPVMINQRKRPVASLFERLFFRRWTRPDWRGGTSTINLSGDFTMINANTEDKTNSEDSGGDAIIYSGNLVPNTELALMAEMAVESQSRKLKLFKGQSMSSPGWFAAGNVLGGFHGAQWCYFNGKRLAKTLKQYLTKKVTA
ncbi:MAG: FAD-dependent oxidoreductase [Verrucomicrobiota bacterium]|nr:FAD-dependent oxidoreductase [Verrucomicrobiota bacterium]